MSVDMIQTILSYNDCRTFLKDYFLHQKSLNSKYSLRYYSQLMGFSGHSHLSSIINGKRKLTEDSVKKLLKVIQLSDHYLEYFKLLVIFDNVSTIEDKEYIYSKMQSLLLKNSAGNLASYQYHYFDEWYYPVLREVAVLGHWKGDFAKLAKLIKPSITISQAKKGLDVLVEMKLLTVENTQYKFSDTSLYTTGLPQFVFQKGRTNAIQSAIVAGETMTPTERTIYCSTIEVSEKKKSKLEELVNSFVHDYELILHENDGEVVSQILQCNVQLFPLSEKLAEELI